MDPDPGICRGFGCGLPGVEKADGRVDQDGYDRDASGHSAAAIAGQRGDLEVHAAPEVSAVSLALADGSERVWLYARRYGGRPPSEVAGSGSGHPDRCHGHRRGPALLSALR